MTKTNKVNISNFIKKQGLLIILSSPSGAGKTSIARALIKEMPDLQLSVSLTTREARKNEKEGIDYYFVSEENFIKHRDNGNLLESAKVFGHYYGTPKDKVNNAMQQGIDTLFDIDWQGAAILRGSAVKDSIVSIFILPPSMQSLEDRLKNRKQDSEKALIKRMQGALGEITHYKEYDYIIVNSDLDESIKIAKSIIIAEKAKRSNQAGIDDFVATFSDYKQGE